MGQVSPTHPNSAISIANSFEKPLIQESLWRPYRATADAATSRACQGKLDPRNFRWDVFDRLIEIYNDRIRMAYPDLALTLHEVDRPDLVFNPMKIRRRRRRLTNQDMRVASACSSASSTATKASTARPSTFLSGCTLLARSR